MAKIKFIVSFDVLSAIEGFRKIHEKNFSEILENGLDFVARILLRDSRKYIPLLTGRLRDSGKIQDLKTYGKQLIWDAANPKNNYIYAGKQYNKVLQHVDGIYAAKWLDKAINENPTKYTRLLTLFIDREYRRLYRQE